jgi:glucosamine-6-phosphate deaminase
VSSTPLRVFPTPDVLGDHLAQGVLARIAQARLTGARFLLGCPTGRTPRPLYGAMARQLAEQPQDLGHLAFVMMDEYLVPNGDGGLHYASAYEPWSCHYFARAEIAGQLNSALPPWWRVREEAFWFPDPRAPEAYDARIADAGGIDLFLLASGASDGHVAFNPPGSPRDSRTRVIPLSDETRRDNLQTFPAFGTLEAVPHHGVSVGIDTIARAKAAVMMVWGAGKRLTLARMRAAERYEADWPATVIHECAGGEIVADEAAAAGD